MSYSGSPDVKLFFYIKSPYDFKLNVIQFLILLKVGGKVGVSINVTYVNASCGHSGNDRRKELLIRTGTHSRNQVPGPDSIPVTIFVGSTFSTVGRKESVTVVTKIPIGFRVYFYRVS